MSTATRAPADRDEPGAAGAAGRSAERRLVPAWVPAALVVVGWLALYPFRRHDANPDGVSYVEVAERWLQGEWSEAVNAYWGPLLSWLAAPLVAIGVPGLDALRVVLLAGALATLVPLRSLARGAGASRVATDALLVGVAPFLVYNALFGLYPDVLMAAALLGSAAQLLRADFVATRRAPVAAGALAAVAYLAKAYAVPVVLVLLPLGAALHALPPRRAPTGRVLRSLGLAAAVFAVVAGVWVGALSARYGELTVSTSAGFNARLVAPGSAGNPYNVPGLHEPTGPDATSAWEEPSRLPVPQRESVDDDGAAPRSELAHRARNVVAHARIIVGSVLRRGAPVAVLALVAVGWHVRRRRWPEPALAGTVALASVHAGGLTLILAIERYTWLAVLALVPAAAVGFDLVTQGRRRRQVGGALAVVVVMAASAAQWFVPRLHEGREVARAAAELEATGALAGADVASTGSWQETMLLCHHVGCRFFGRPDAATVFEAWDDLAAAGVDHLVVWGDDVEELIGLPPVEPGTDLAVYERTAEGFRLDRMLRLDG